MQNVIVIVLILSGVAFVAIAAIGVVRMPDFYARLHAATKAGAFGVALLLAAAAVHFASFAESVLAFLAIAFFYLTAPVAGHLLGRAAYLLRAPTWQGTWHDDLRGHYDRHEGTLRGEDDTPKRED